MDKIKQVTLMTTKSEEYIVDSQHILACEYIMKPENIESSDNYFIEEVMVLENILLVIQDYENNLINLDTFLPYNLEEDVISQISIEYKDGEIKTCYVNLTALDKNEFQRNILDGSTLYITIDEDL